jgi:predicted GNAT family N-acyltransferase
MRVISMTTPEEFAEALAVRFAVFVGEQGVSPEAERDGIDVDPRTIHVLAYGDDGQVLGTGRLVAPHSDSAHGAAVGFGNMDPSHPHIGRMAVLASARGAGAGKALMIELERQALALFGGGRRIRVELSAQDHALPFYERLGYTTFGDGYLDEGIPHHDAFKIVVPR